MITTCRGRGFNTALGYFLAGLAESKNISVIEMSFDENNKSRIHNGEKSGLAADHWNRYAEDIVLMQEKKKIYFIDAYALIFRGYYYSS